MRGAGDLASLTMIMNGIHGKTPAMFRFETLNSARVAKALQNVEFHCCKKFTRA